MTKNKSIKANSIPLKSAAPLNGTAYFYQKTLIAVVYGKYNVYTSEGVVAHAVGKAAATVKPPPIHKDGGEPPIITIITPVSTISITYHPPPLGAPSEAPIITIHPQDFQL
jgi:hypothetical protein